MRTQDEIENEIHELQSRKETHEEKIRENTAEIEKTRALNVEFLSGEPDRQRLPASVSTRREAIVKLAVDSDERREVIERIKEQISALGLEHEAAGAQSMLETYEGSAKLYLEEKAKLQEEITDLIGRARGLMDTLVAFGTKPSPLAALDTIIRHFGTIDLQGITAGEIRKDIGGQQNRTFVDSEVQRLLPASYTPAFDFQALANVINKLRPDPREGSIWKQRILGKLPRVDQGPRQEGRPPELGYKVEKVVVRFDPDRKPQDAVFPEGGRRQVNE